MSRCARLIKLGCFLVWSDSSALPSKMNKTPEKKYEDAVSLALTLTFFTATYVKAEETAERYGSIRLTSKKTHRNLKLPFTVVEEVVKKLPFAVDRCNSAKPPTENDTLLYDEVFELNNLYILSLCVTSYEQKNFVFIKPKKWSSNEERYVPQLGKFLKADES